MPARVVPSKPSRIDEVVRCVKVEFATAGSRGPSFRVGAPRSPGGGVTLFTRAPHYEWSLVAHYRVGNAAFAREAQHVTAVAAGALEGSPDAGVDVERLLVLAR